MDLSDHPQLAAAFRGILAEQTRGVGHSSRSHFSETPGKHLGMPPTAFRTSHA